MQVIPLIENGLATSSFESQQFDLTSHFRAGSKLRARLYVSTFGVSPYSATVEFRSRLDKNAATNYPILLPKTVDTGEVVLTNAAPNEVMRDLAFYPQIELRYRATLGPPVTFSAYLIVYGHRAS